MSLGADGHHLERSGVAGAQAGTDGAADGLEELPGIAHRIAERREVRAVRLREATPASNVTVVSTACFALGDAAAHTWRTPAHGWSPSSSSSRNTHRLAASRTASTVARPTAMWSAWLSQTPS